MVKFEKLWGKLIFALWEDEGSYLLTSYQFAKFKDQINIGSGYWVISVNGMCRSNVIIYQNETKFEIYHFCPFPNFINYFIFRLYVVLVI
jgi:hypothetical protein